MNELAPPHPKVSPTLSVILPLYDSAGHLEAVLAPLAEALRTGSVDEVLVIDDSSADEGPEICRRAGLRVLESGGRLGPAACRNLGVGEARGDVFLFIDSDVVMHAGVPDRVRQAFASAPEIAAVFGSYDDSPSAPGIVSRYRNLLHHHVHQSGDPEASTFWAGCGAVRREPFEDVGGFDAARFGRPAIEDIELGLRLKRAGHRIRLDGEMLCTHLKRWTFAGMVKTDIFQRALPWSRLILTTGQELTDLNVKGSERLKAIVALVVWGATLAGLVWPPAFIVAAAAWLGAVAANADFYRLVRRREGLAAALAAVFLHQLYYLYGTLAFAWCWLEAKLRIGRGPGRKGR